jgi:hypothetical protein
MAREMGEDSGVHISVRAPSAKVERVKRRFAGTGG